MLPVHPHIQYSVVQLVRKISNHEVVIRSSREDVLNAVRRDFGSLFKYWQLDEPSLPSDGSVPKGAAVLVVDDELLPKDEHGEKVRVPTNTKLQAIASKTDVAAGDGSDGAPPPSEKRGEGPSSMRTAFN